MIPRETADRILDTAKVEEVIGEFVTLKRQGANYLACCPFHNEKTPSFTVSPAKGFYYCFGCKKGGSAVTFLMDHENLSYSEALRFLAKKYGIEIVEKEETAEDIKARQHSESLYIVSDFAQKYFASNLKEGEGRALGYQYFKSRGLEDATIEKFGLGWSPTDRYALLNAAKAAGHKEEYLIDTGLCIKIDENSKVYDRFHERVVFPIHNAAGRVVAFSCRTLRSDKTVAKYVNSPETEIYTKSKSLYGIWFAKQQMAKLDKCILVEGNLDMISMHQLGITNVVASCGTSLTKDQIRLIKRFTQNVTIIYDGDSAGIHAALRGIGLVLQEGLNVKVVLLPDGMDPDDFTKKHTLEEVQKFIADGERDFIGFKTDLLLEEAGDDPLKRANLINDIADTIALIPDPVKRAMYAESCAARFELDKKVLLDRINRTNEQVLEEERKAYERERAEKERREAAQDPQLAPDQTREQTVRLDGATGIRKVKVVPIMEPAERCLLDFILNHGLDIIHFVKGDKSYPEGGDVTVADFIDSSLSQDDALLTVGVHQRVYDEYFRLYDEGLQQEEIIRKLVNHENQEVSKFVVDMTVTRYEVTEKNLKASMTNSGTLLRNEVPKAIMTFHLKCAENRLDECRRALKQPGADAMAILKEINELNRKRNFISNALGRI